MGDDADQLRALLVRFAHDPDDAEWWPIARELADRFTLDQLRAMAATRAGEVGRMFDRILGRAVRRAERREVRRPNAVAEGPPSWRSPVIRRRGTPAA
jgi:hypothetical protein